MVYNSKSGAKCGSWSLRDGAQMQLRRCRQTVSWFPIKKGEREYFCGGSLLFSDTTVRGDKKAMVHNIFHWCRCTNTSLADMVHWKPCCVSGHKQVCSQFVSVQVCLGPRKGPHRVHSDMDLMWTDGGPPPIRTCYKPIQWQDPVMSHLWASDKPLPRPDFQW